MPKNIHLPTFFFVTLTIICLSSQYFVSASFFSSLSSYSDSAYKFSSRKAKEFASALIPIVKSNSTNNIPSTSSDKETDIKNDIKVVKSKPYTDVEFVSHLVDDLSWQQQQDTIKKELEKYIQKKEAEQPGLYDLDQQKHQDSSPISQLTPQIHPPISASPPKISQDELPRQNDTNTNIPIPTVPFAQILSTYDSFLSMLIPNPIYGIIWFSVLTGLFVKLLFACIPSSSPSSVPLMHSASFLHAPLPSAPLLPGTSQPLHITQEHNPSPTKSTHSTFPSTPQPNTPQPPYLLPATYPNPSTSQTHPLSQSQTPTPPFTLPPIDSPQLNPQSFSALTSPGRPFNSFSSPIHPSSHSSIHPLSHPLSHPSNHPSNHPSSHPSNHPLHPFPPPSYHTTQAFPLTPYHPPIPTPFPLVQSLQPPPALSLPQKPRNFPFNCSLPTLIILSSLILFIWLFLRGFSEYSHSAIARDELRRINSQHSTPSYCTDGALQPNEMNFLRYYLGYKSNLFDYSSHCIDVEVKHQAVPSNDTIIVLIAYCGTLLEHITQMIRGPILAFFQINSVWEIASFTMMTIVFGILSFFLAITLWCFCNGSTTSSIGWCSRQCPCLCCCFLPQSDTCCSLCCFQSYQLCFYCISRNCCCMTDEMEKKIFSVEHRVKFQPETTALSYQPQHLSPYQAPYHPYHMIPHFPSYFPPLLDSSQHELIHNSPVAPQLSHPSFYPFSPSSIPPYIGGQFNPDYFTMMMQFYQHAHNIHSPPLHTMSFQPRYDHIHPFHSSSYPTSPPTASSTSTSTSTSSSQQYPFFAPPTTATPQPYSTHFHPTSTQPQQVPSHTPIPFSLDDLQSHIIIPSSHNNDASTSQVHILSSINNDVTIPQIHIPASISDNSTSSSSTTSQIHVKKFNLRQPQHILQYVRSHLKKNNEGKEIYPDSKKQSKRKKGDKKKKDPVKGDFDNIFAKPSSVENFPQLHDPEASSIVSSQDGKTGSSQISPNVLDVATSPRK